LVLTRHPGLLSDLILPIVYTNSTAGGIRNFTIPTSATCVSQVDYKISCFVYKNASRLKNDCFSKMRMIETKPVEYVESNCFIFMF